MHGACFSLLDAPLWLELLERLALRMIADDFDVDVPAQIELFGAELRH